MNLELNKKECVPCRGGIPPLKRNKVKEYLANLKGWELIDDKIRKVFTFKNYKETIKFVNKVANIAEKEGHHPDMCIYYGKVDVILWTHKIKGLHENDFIMAAKIDKII